MSRKHSILTAGVAALIALASCADDAIDGAALDGTGTRAAQEVTKPGGLIQQTDGTWKTQNCRVPIVGPGRVVNEINASTVNVINVSSNGLGNIVDTDITNACTVPTALSASAAYTPIVSVKDLYHTYSAGQKVGFVYKDTDSGGATLLNLTVLQGLTLETYLNGTKQESVYAADETSTLNLDLLSFNTGSTVSDRVLQFEATKPFDEVRMSLTGVSTTAASNIALAIKYAFVGENPEIRATSETEFASYWGDNTSPTINKGTLNSLTNVANAENLVNDKTDDYAAFTSQLGVASKATINLNRTIPAGTEIGFYYKTGKVLDFDVVGQNAPTLTSFDANNKQVEESTPSTSLLGVGLIGFSGMCTTNMVTKEACTQIQFQHPTKLVDLGGMNVYYAYVREAVTLDPANYFTFGDDVTYSYSYKLPTVSVGEVTYNLLSKPYGSAAEIKDGKLTGMTKDGSYRVQAFYTSEDGRELSHTATIYHKSVTATSGCNNYITAASHGAYATEASGSTACLLCLFNSSNDLNNVVDGDDSNYASVINVLSTLEWTPMAAFKMNKAIVPSGTVRTGFVVQASTSLLDLSALSLYKIRLYNGSTLVSEETADGAGTVKLSLIGYDQSKARLCVETTKQFDRIELWRKGVADVGTSMRIYSLFYEPTSCNEATTGGGCMELLTNVKDNLQIDYDNTTVASGLLSAGTTFTNLDYMLDGSVETGAQLSSIISAASETTIALKFNEQKANQSVGIILKGLTNIANVSLAKVGILKAYKDNSEVTVTADWSTLSADLLSDGDYTYLEITPKSAYNRIEFTSASGVSLLSSTKICGVYIRPDSDSDGIPDCADTDTDGSSVEIDGSDFHTCYGNALNIPLTKSTDITAVSLYCYNQDTKKDINCTGTISGTVLTVNSTTLPVGHYLLYIYSADGDKLLAYDIKATVHPTTTTWKTNATTTEWNTWENWSDGTPWKCTNVILPSNAARYPELTSAKSNYCNSIHFETGAELIGTQYLTMQGMAFVDMALQGGRYYLLSAPLQETYTGDMFIAPGTVWGKSKYFTALAADNYPESRNQPIVYQYFWNGTAMEKTETSDGTDVGTAEWSTDFNCVSTKYTPAQGFLLRASTASDRNGYTFRFPKTHGTYHYYRSNGTIANRSETISRTAANIGKFAMTTPSTVTLTNKTSSTTFLMGNPFMAHINVAKLLAANSNNITEIRVLSGGSSSMPTDINSQTVSSSDNTSLFIAPMEAFFVVAKSEATELTVTLNSDMITQGN